MARVVQRLTFAAASLAGAVVLSAPAGATPTCQPGLTCPRDGVGLTPRYGQPIRSARRKRLIHQALVSGARALEAEPAVAVPSRYVSLLILGVGF